MSSDIGRRIRELGQQRAEAHRNSDRDDIISAPRFTEQLLNAHPDTMRVYRDAERRVEEIKRRKVNGER